MKQSAYERIRDTGIADDAIEDESQQCPARGCPHRWTCLGSRGKACGAHYFAPRSEWPRITERLIARDAELALERSSAPAATVLSREEKSAILERLRRLGGDPGSDRGWALWLHARHEAGEHLTRFQIDAYMRTMNLESRRLSSYLPQPAGVRA